jgi:hypothetical protein
MERATASRSATMCPAPSTRELPGDALGRGVAYFSGVN